MIFREATKRSTRNRLALRSSSWYHTYVACSTAGFAPLLVTSGQRGRVSSLYAGVPSLQARSFSLAVLVIDSRVAPGTPAAARPRASCAPVRGRRGTIRAARVPSYATRTTFAPAVGQGWARACAGEHVRLFAAPAVDLPEGGVVRFHYRQQASRGPQGGRLARRLSTVHLKCKPRSREVASAHQIYGCNRWRVKRS
ncbi:hypothetical protein MRX96_013688 [Rhipicephalus microplus]